MGFCVCVLECVCVCVCVCAFRICLCVCFSTVCDVCASSSHRCVSEWVMGVLSSCFEWEWCMCVLVHKSEAHAWECFTDGLLATPAVWMCVFNHIFFVYFCVYVWVYRRKVFWWRHVVFRSNEDTHVICGCCVFLFMTVFLYARCE